MAVGAEYLEPVRLKNGVRIRCQVVDIKSPGRLLDPAQLAASPPRLDDLRPEILPHFLPSKSVFVVHSAPSAVPRPTPGPSGMRPSSPLWSSCLRSSRASFCFSRRSASVALLKPPGHAGPILANWHHSLRLGNPPAPKKAQPVGQLLGYLGVSSSHVLREWPDTIRYLVVK
jgi:hypothetical protein